VKITALSNHKPGILNNYIRILNVGGFLRELLFPPPIKVAATIKQKYC
jgi:hypothetical protein